MERVPLQDLQGLEGRARLDMFLLGKAHAVEDYGL